MQYVRAERHSRPGRKRRVNTLPQAALVRTLWYASPVFKLLAAPATNDRGPRYMERALASIHQADRSGEPVTLLYAVIEDRVALLVRVADHLEEFVTNPIAANYPNCSLTTIAEPDGAPPGWETWSVELELCPELFPILRHAQFEDLLNRTFADPVSGILRSIRPADDVRCRIEMQITPAGPRRRRTAQRGDSASRPGVFSRSPPTRRVLRRACHEGRGQGSGMASRHPGPTVSTRSPHAAGHVVQPTPRPRGAPASGVR